MARVVKDAASRREEIVATAGMLFLTNGYDRTTMRDVMDRLQVAKGTIYHYFRSKEELLDAVIADLVEQSTRAMADVLARTTGNGLERLRQLVEQSVAEEALQRREMIEHLHQPANNGMHIRLNAGIVTSQAPLYGVLIEQGCEEGIFKTAYPLESAEFILAAVQFLTDVGFYPWDEEQLARRVAAFPMLIESLLGAPAGSFTFLTALLQHGAGERESKQTA